MKRIQTAILIVTCMVFFSLHQSYQSRYLSSEWILALREEAHAAQSFKLKDLQRPHYRDKIGVDLQDGCWMRGWSNDPKWLTYALIYYGKELHHAQKRQPMTLRFISKTFGTSSVLLAGYSLLKPNGSIPPHKDEDTFVNAKKSIHVGLFIPEDCELIVDGRHFQEETGKILRFNDSVEHSACNRSKLDRMILYVKLF